uniref:RING-type domain-containing protein n=1 Tax=Sinocyclocheilus anshuiensis TaxID=1608454 RepID=A0A671LYU7_9TELE
MYSPELKLIYLFFFFLDFATTNVPLAEELQCSACLDVFTDPVTIPCRQSFCENCLDQCWDNRLDCKCPSCNETFSKRPDLKINPELREAVQLFKEKPSLSKSEVVCDICDDDRKLKRPSVCSHSLSLSPC